MGELSLQHIANDWGNKVIDMYAVAKADPEIFEVASGVFSLCYTHFPLLVRVGGSCYLINGLQKISW